MDKYLIPAFLLTAFAILGVDASISSVVDFLTHLSTSYFWISLFIGFNVISILVSLTFFRLLRDNSSQILANSMKLRILSIIVFAAQLSLMAIFAVIAFEIVLFSQYDTVMLSVASVIVGVSTVGVMIISSLVLFSWYRISKHSYVVLIFGVAFALNVYIYLYLEATHVFNLAGKDELITANSEVIFSSDTFLPGSPEEVLWNIYDYASTGVFLLFITGSATMLYHYAGRIGRLRFWTLILLPSFYYLSTLVDTLGLFVPETDAELFYYYLYVSLNGVIGGALLGFAFWNISKTMRANRLVANYLLICSYGFVLYSIASTGVISAAAFPPFGLASYTLLPISSYMIILGLYSTAVSISQDIRLRQYIKNLTRTDSGFLSTIGQAQLEKQVQAKASDLEGVVMEKRLELEKKSGVQSSIQEQDIKKYLMEVLQEVDKHKQTK